MQCCDCGEPDHFPVIITLGLLAVAPADRYRHWFRCERGQYYITRCRDCEHKIAYEIALRDWNAALARARERWHARGRNTVGAPHQGRELYVAPADLPPPAADQRMDLPPLASD